MSSLLTDSSKREQKLASVSLENQRNPFMTEAVII